MSEDPEFEAAEPEGAGKVGGGDALLGSDASPPLPGAPVARAPRLEVAAAAVALSTTEVAALRRRHRWPAGKSMSAQALRAAHTAWRQGPLTARGATPPRS